LKNQGKAVIFSTHQMDQAEKLSDGICLINRGKMVLEGSVKEVKQRFGKNSVHIEYAGNGSFLKELPFIKQATVYENYAELVLTDSISSNEILNSVSSKIDVRKFEYVEPSLNSIFIEVVGRPATNDQSEPVKVQTKSQPQNIFKDKRVKKELFSLLSFASITFIVLIAKLFVATLSWNVAGIFALGTVATLFKFMKVKNTVALELRRKEGGNNER